MFISVLNVFPSPSLLHLLASNSTCVQAIWTVLGWLAVSNPPTKLQFLLITDPLPFIFMLQLYLETWWFFFSLELEKLVRAKITWEIHPVFTKQGGNSFSLYFCYLGILVISDNISWQKLRPGVVIKSCYIKGGKVDSMSTHLMRSVVCLNMTRFFNIEEILLFEN